MFWARGLQIQLSKLRKTHDLLVEQSVLMADAMDLVKQQLEDFVGGVRFFKGGKGETFLEYRFS